MINASREFRKGTPKNYLPDEAIKQIANSYLKAEPEKTSVAVITNDKAAENDFNLSPSRYLTNGTSANFRKIAEIKADLESLEEEAEKINQELKKVLAQLK